MEREHYKKIMVATDGSKPVRKAIETGIDLARLSGAKLYAVYVIIPAGSFCQRLWVGKISYGAFQRTKGRKP